MLAMTPAEIDTLLHDTLIGRLAMADCSGRPYTIPLPFCWMDGALYLRLAMTGRKGQILAENDHVCFEVDWFTSSLEDYASVLIEGQLVPVTDLAEKERVRQTNATKYQRLRRGFRPGHGRATPLEQLPLRKIVVAALAGRRKIQPQQTVPLQHAAAQRA